MRPNRWLHVRHPAGFDTEQFAKFEAHCRIFRAYVEAVLAEWPLLRAGELPPQYEFFDAELSHDRTIATLPLGGEQTLGTRHQLEDMRSRMLWEHFPAAFQLELEEGLTEADVADRTKLRTEWRKAGRLLVA